MLFMGIAATAVADVLNWPTNGWAPLYGQSSLYSDIPNDTGNSGHEYLDYVGDTNHAAAFFSYRLAVDSGEADDQLLFRVRLDDKKQKMPGAYQVFFETDYNASVDWVLQVSTDDLDTDGIIEFGSASGTNRSGVAFGAVVWASNFVGSVGYVNWTGAATGDGSMFNGNIDYFLEFGMPWDVFTNHTGVTSTNDPLRLLITSSQSSGQIDDGDIGNSSAGFGVDVAFTNIYVDPDPDPGPFPQTITFANPGNQVVTNAIVLAATASSGLPVDFAVISGPGLISSQSNLTFSGTGTVVVVGSQAGNSTWFPAPPVTNSFTIAKANAALNISGLNPTFDGNPHPVSVNTTPTGLVTHYNGSASAPTNAGSYTVIVSVIDALYQGTVTNTLTIAKADQTINIPNPGPQAVPHAVILSASASSGLPVSLSVDSGPGAITGTTLTFTNSGIVVINADQVGNSNWNAAATNISISVLKAPATVLLGGLNATYDGTAQTATATTSPTGLPTVITYNGSTVAPTNAGTYTVIAVINDNAYVGSSTNTFTISKGDQSISFPNPGAQVSTNAVSLSATATSGLSVTNFSVISGPANLSGSMLTFTGSGTVWVSAAQSGNGNWNAATPVTNSFSVSKASAAINVGGLNPTYDGNSKAVSVTTVPGGQTVDITYDGSSAAPTNAGSYTVIVTVNEPLYQGSVTNTLTIAKADQIINFINPGAQAETNTVSLQATADSGPACRQLPTVAYRSCSLSIPVRRCCPERT
jgi:hypothetical protein